MKILNFIFFWCLLFCINNSVAQINNLENLTIDELQKNFNETSINKNKLNNALQIILKYINEDKDDSAQIWFEKISTIRNVNQVSNQEYIFQTMQTELYYFSDLFYLADQSNNEAIIIAQKLNNKFFLANAYFYKGLILQEKGEHNDALANFMIASKYNPNTYNKEFEGYIAQPNHIYNNIAQEYNTLKQWDSSYYYCKLALEILKKNPVNRSEALIYNDLATMFVRTNQSDSALKYYQKALVICQREKILDIPLLLYIGMANLMLNEKDNTAAIQFLEKGKNQLKYNIGNYYTRVFFHEAITIYKKLNDKEGALKMYENLQELNQKNNTLYNHQLLSIYKHSNDNKNKLLKASLESSKLKQRNSTIQLIFLTILLLSSGISFFLYRKRQLTNNKLKVVKHDIGKDLHDEMGATISSIKMFCELAQNNNITEGQRNELSTKIGNLTTDLGEKLNTIIWSMEEKNDTIENLVEKLQQYSISLFEASEIQFQFSQNNGFGNISKLKGLQRKNMFLVSKEALNNVVKHADATKVWMYISCKEKLIQVEIIDNGKGIKSANKFGNGLKNMKNRMDEINGTVEWTEKNGTIVTIICHV